MVLVRFGGERRVSGEKCTLPGVERPTAAEVRGQVIKDYFVRHCVIVVVGLLNGCSLRIRFKELLL